MKTIRRLSSNTLTLISTLLLAGTLAACGGGGSGGTNAASSAGSTTAHYSIAGSVSGLAAGEQVTLQNNGANSLTVSANGTFTFTDSVAANGSYAVTVSSQPVGQVCSITGGTGSGSGVNANVGNVSIACSYDTYSIGGTVSGLAGGEQVTLLNNGANALTVNANGAFTFTSPVAYNGSYAVTVSSQPTGQICSVTGGTGSGSGVVANVGNVGIACSYDIYTIGGTVTGLVSGAQVTLVNNGGNALRVSANGTFTFTSLVAYNGSYAVTVSGQPAGQTCSVTGGTGSGSGVTANVGNVSIACSSQTYTIGGTVTGLAGGAQVTLLNNGANALTVNANGAFIFTSPVAYNASYAVTVSGQPNGQTCSVTGGTGSGSGVTANVSNVSIACSSRTYTIGGNVTGLASGAQVTLLNNGANALTVSANGAFTFTSPVAYNGSYAVTVSGQPTGQTCSVTGGTGSGSGVTANVGNVSIACSSQTYTIGGTVTGLAGGTQVTLLNNGANALTVGANGAFTFTSPVAYNGSYAVTVSGQPTGQTCTVTNAIGASVNANISNVGVSCTATSGGGGSPGSVAPSTGWTNVKMGGGGYVPGVIYHPTVANLRYARTDVAGTYRWNNSSSNWIALTDAFGRPDGGNEGAESMAVDPTDASKVYMTTSQAASYGNGRFYYSSNQGSTWQYVTLPFPVGSNNQGRAIGERLVVDPNLPSTMFYASRTAGLWKSTNSGMNWSQVTSLSSYVMSSTDMNNSNGGSPIGVEFAVFGATVPTTGFTPTGSATQTIYVGVAPDYKGLAGLSSYLYKSTDGGATWTGIAVPAAVTSAIASNQIHIPHLARAADGMLYVPFASSSGPGSGSPSFLYKFDGGTTWTPLTHSGDGNYYGGIGGLSVYGTGSTTKIVFGVSGTWGDAAWVQIAMRSADDGQTWQEIGRSGDTNGSQIYHNGSGYWGWVDDLKIDPFNPNHVSYVVGGGIWSTIEAFSTSTPHWTFDVNGIEEMVDLVMMAPPPGASYVLASGQGDTGLYVHTSLTTSATRSPNLGGGNGTGIDMAWNNPAYVAAVGTFSTSKGAYSTDSGVSWTNFPTLPPVAATHSGDQSKVVVTADGSNVIWAIAGAVPYYTTNNGTTWTATNLPAPAVAYHIAADRKNPLKVYAYEHGGNFWYPSNSGRFYYSTDGGHTFTASLQTWGPNGFGVTDLAVNPFAEGDIWLADANNLWHSVDSGATWTKLTTMATVGAEYTNFHGAIKVALGVPAAGSTYSAAVYLVGTINGTDGVYRSDDKGVTWTRIDDNNHRYGGVSGIVADTSVYGRVFLAGRGMDYNY